MPKNSQSAETLDKLAEELEKSQPSNEVAAEAKKKEENSYQPAENEKNLYHVELEKILFDRNTGKKLSKAVVQKFTRAEYNQLVGKKNEKDKSNAEMLGYTVKLLYAPSEK